MPNQELAVEAPRRQLKPSNWVPWKRGQGGRICAVGGCGKPVRSSGWCMRHYRSWLAHGTPEPHKSPDLQGEEWRPAPGWEDRYSVSNQGRIKNASTGRILSTRFHPKRRYCAIHLFINGTSVDRYLHVLVAEAFLGPKPAGPESSPPAMMATATTNAVAGIIRRSFDATPPPYVAS